MPFTTSMIETSCGVVTITINPDKPDDRFNGGYRVVGVTHRFTRSQEPPNMAPLKMMSRAITFLAAAALLPAAQLSAAEFRSDQTVTVAAEERIDGNLYAFGERVVIDGVVDGDLVVFGSQITINGTVEGDVAGAGQTIVVAGKIGDDARIAGQVLKLDQQAQIGGDLLAGGFSLELAPGSSVEGDVTYGGFQALLAGKIVGDVTSGLANCLLSGETTGDIKLEVGGDPERAGVSQTEPDAA